MGDRLQSQVSYKKKRLKKKVREKQITSRSKLIGLLQQAWLKKSFQEEFGKMHVQHFGLSAQSLVSM